MNDPTNTQSHDTLGAQLATFRDNPGDGELYAELRARLIDAKADGQMAELAELRAPHVRDPLRASATWAEAGLGRARLGDRGAAERDLRTALSLDPANEAAAKILVDLFIEQRRYAEAAASLDAELDELAKRAERAPPGATNGPEPFGKRRAERHRLLAHLWDRELGRVDQALAHWQRAWQLEPENTKSLEAARLIYASLGDEGMVIQLYEAELEVLADSKLKTERARVEFELGRLLLKTGNFAGAAGHLEIALRLEPGREDASVALAEAYASPHYTSDPESNRRAGKLFVELGKARLEAGETVEAIRFLRRALGVDPYTFSGFQLLEEALRRAQRWDELDRLYSHRSEAAESEEEREVLLKKRAALYDEQLQDRGGLKSSLEKLAGQKGARTEAAARLRELYRADGDWEKLTALLESNIAGLEHDPHAQIAEILELASVYRENRRDRDRAAELLHQVLSIDPHNEEALGRYAEHFRERRDWRGLADLLEFGIENAQEQGSSVSEIVRRLEELAKLCELRLGDVERAIATWQRIDEIEPGNPRVREAIRRLMSRAKMWESLVGVLEQEAASAATPEARAHALARIAQVYRERQVNPRQAIALYEEVLQTTPDDEGILKALTELYEREGDDAGLASTIRRQLDLDMRRIAAQLGGQPLAKDWPVAKRVERLTALRRLAAMYEEKLADVEGVVFACGGVLEILPGDRDALEKMERVLEKAGDIERLEQTLEYHAAAATGPAEKAKVLRRLARLASGRADEVVTMQRWEQVVAAAPNDREGLEALAGLYERHQRWGELATVLERNLLHRSPPDPGSPEAANRAQELKRYAEVVHRRLGDANRAARAWQSVLEISPKDRDALAALAVLHETAGRWRDLAGVLERLAPLYQSDEPQQAAEVMLRRAELLEERLGAPAEAASALEALIGDLDPRNLKAHQALRRIYESRADFEAAVRIAEREMYLTDAGPERVARGIAIGFLCRDRLGEPARALQAFERVLVIDAANSEALVASAELYAKLERWPEHVAALERQVEGSDTGSERRALLLRIGAATGDKLGDYRRAFDWYRAAHEHAPDATTIAELRRTAETFDLWSELAVVYETEREAHRGGDVHSFVAACRELAAISERRLGDPARAMAAFRDALTAQPDGEDLLGETERIAREADSRPLWEIFCDCLGERLAVADAAGRVAIHGERARLREERLGDPNGAMEDLLRAFAVAPDREEARTALYELAERSGAWKDVVAVEAALFERADTTDRRIAILFRKAQIIEDKLTNPVRAFRTFLSAFLLAPENQDAVSHLWRLAREIQRYDPSDRVAKPEPAAAHVEETESAPVGRPPRARPKRGAATRARPQRLDATQELNIADLLDVRARDDDDDDLEELPLDERTMPIDLTEIEEMAPRGDPTMELRTQDLIEVLGARTQGIGAPPPPPERGTRSKGPPPPPPPPPKIYPSAPGMPRPLGQRPNRSARPAPTLPSRSHDSPWAELAAAYNQLPARDTTTRLRWLFRAAEVWESGAADVVRAFETLARAMELAPDESEPRDRLHRLARDHGEWDRLAELYELAAETAGSIDRAVSLLIDVAEVRTHEERTGEAEGIYRRILGMCPDHEDARVRIEALYREQGRWVDLAASLEERTDPRLGVAAPEPQRPVLLRELAEIYADKLSRHHDAIDALERLRGLAPDDTDVLAQLADLYGEIGRWSKVVEMLKKVSDVADDGPRAQEAMRRIGHIYEIELELPDRAIETYTQLAATWPNDADAYAALDRLYDSHGKWEELAAVLERRAALTRGSAERVELLRRRATVLIGRIDAPEEAAVSLRQARTLAPEDAGLADMLVDALVGSGAEREAEAIIEGRIEASKKSATDGDIAALLTRLARLRADHLRDPEGAKRAIEAALERVPNHPSALATLARLAEARHDPAAYAEAKLREARVQDDVDARVAALLAAARALREIGNVEAARSALEEVLGLRSFQPEATWALAALVEESGDLTAAAKLLERRLADQELTVDERAEVLTQLAALARSAGVDSVAERRLSEALNVAPQHFPAVLGMADLLSEADRNNDLVEFLDDVVPQLARAPESERAELLRRLAVAQETLGQDEEAYQTLLGADRLERGNLLIKLAMGENRYRARRWREAALHLSALASHEHAERYPAEIAEGLYHAALAEIRSLRPEKAEALYERAADLKPNYAPALRALSEIALEAGDNKRAADLLTRQATATKDPAERMRLFEALGDMAMTTLEDSERALVCYEAAVGAAQPLEAVHLPLLNKLLTRQLEASDSLGSARTAELMAAFADNSSTRAQTLKIAAEGYLAAGQKERARSAAERAIQADPFDLTAVGIASEIRMEDGEYEETAALLGRALSGATEDVDELTAARQALLYYRLGTARLKRGDQAGATAALETAINVAPQADGAMLARRALLSQWKDVPQRSDELIEFRRQLAADTMDPEDVAGYAHDLIDIGSDDGARVALELAATLGRELDNEEVAFLGTHPVRQMAEDESYKGAVDADDRLELLADDDDHPLAEAFAALWEAAPLLWNDADDALAAARAGGAERIAATSEVPAAAVFTRIARALAAPATVLFADQRREAPDAKVCFVSPPIIVMGPNILGTGDEQPSDLELRFLLARAAELARPERIFAAGMRKEDFEQLIAALVRLFGSGQAGAQASPADEELRKSLPVKVRQRLAELLGGGVTQRQIERFRQACERVADRAGLLICGDLDTARRSATNRGVKSTRYLERLVLSKRFLDARFRLGIGIKRHRSMF